MIWAKQYDSNFPLQFLSFISIHSAVIGGGGNITSTNIHIFCPNDRHAAMALSDTPLVASPRCTEEKRHWSWGIHSWLCFNCARSWPADQTGLLLPVRCMANNARWSWNSARLSYTTQTRVKNGLKSYNVCHLQYIKDRRRGREMLKCFNHWIFES